VSSPTPYWLATAPSLPTSSQTLPRQVDVAVIGGGLTGLSAALHLAEKGATVTVLEQNRIGSGASGRNGGMCTNGATLTFGALMRRYGPETAAQLFRVYSDAIDLVEALVEKERIECCFARWGKLVLAAKPEHYERLQAEADALARYVGHEVRTIPRDRLPAEIDSPHYHGGQLDPGSAGLHVGRFVMGLAEAALRRGVDVMDGVKVTGVRVVRGESVLQTSAGSLRAGQVLLATNGYTDKAVPYFQRRVVAVRAASITTDPLPGELARELMPGARMATDTSNLITYFRLTPDNRLLIGGRAAYGVSDRRSDQASTRTLRAKLTAIFPRLRDVRIDHAWSGLTGFTLDRIPHAGEHAGIYYSLGYCGHGVQMATYMGRQMAEVMDGNPQANPWRSFRLRPIPLYFGRPWFLPLSDLYYKVKDRLS